MLNTTIIYDQFIKHCEPLTAVRFTISTEMYNVEIYEQSIICLIPHYAKSNSTLMESVEVAHQNIAQVLFI